MNEYISDREVIYKLTEENTRLIKKLQVKNKTINKLTDELDYIESIIDEELSSENPLIKKITRQIKDILN